MGNGHFDEDFGNWLPDEEEDNLVCDCPNCGMGIYEGQKAIEYNGDYYCDKNCFVEGKGASWEVAERSDD